ncbi:MAG TPA: aconitate hydratase AcnA, partial [Planctomycetaceae bacterium]|nr:aconitate hydratase AcnA [Planctomycetaceae bacterium]
MSQANPFNAEQTLKTSFGDYQFFNIQTLAEQGLGDVSKLPFSIRVLLESCLRNWDDFVVGSHDVKNLASWDAQNVQQVEIPFHPGRVVLQDFTGVPAIVDLAALRSAMVRMGGDPTKINPLVPCDLVIDHSVQVDAFANNMALEQNVEIEFERNMERYQFLRWGQQAFDNFRVIPPATGIVHQVNLEYLAKVVLQKDGVLSPDSLVGTDSHTTMINGLGVLGWGVGGIEAEAVMLGQPIYMLMPEVVGFKVTGELPEGATATDLVLTVTQMLRAHGVVGKFVEYFGPGLQSMLLPDRATLANMAPEYGATCGFFPVDQETLRYMERTGRTAQEVELVEKYYKAQGMFHDANTPDPTFTSVLELDLSTVEPSLAGPKRPQDRILLNDMKPVWEKALEETFKRTEDSPEVEVKFNGQNPKITDGAVVIAAITSCTNTSNPSVLMAAGLLAQKAAAKGLTRKPWVKTSLAPGSRVVTDYLERAGLMPSLEALGFNTVGYGCTTCIGNSGPLQQEVSQAVSEGDLVVSAVLSGNRNFEGRINQQVKANYLASPPLVVAYAIAGTMNINVATDPLGEDADGNPVYLKDIWPTSAEIADVVRSAVTPDMFAKRYADVFKGDAMWQGIETSGGLTYDWPESTYVANPPFFTGMTTEVTPPKDIDGARILGLFGDSITTDHISPAGSIKADSPAGLYLQEKGVEPREFNSYGARRGNHDVMMRGTFANIRIKNQMVPGVEGGVTKLQPSGEEMPIYDAAMKYAEADTPLVVFGGKEYGTGSSRDWAAKGTRLLGVKAVICESFERIHRSNLVGMGVVPLQFQNGESWSSLGLTGKETISLKGIEG